MHISMLYFLLTKIAGWFTNLKVSLLPRKTKDEWFLKICSTFLGLFHFYELKSRFKDDIVVSWLSLNFFLKFLLKPESKACKAPQIFRPKL